MSNPPPYWRPWTLRKLSLVSFIGLCVGLLVVSELANFGCKRHGSCRVFGHNDNGHMPVLSAFVYRTVPAILGVALGLRWFATHYDIIRLEAYSQMSSKYGAKASGSLFLQYPYEFVVALPFKALLKEHYIVALSSSILFLVSYALVPLVPNMFDDTIDSSSSFINASRVEFNSTARQVPANFTFSAYDYAWRNGTLPPFTTEDFALLPVKPLDGPAGFRPGENWTVFTTLYEADIECTEAHRISYNYSYWPDNTHRVIEIFRNDSSVPAVRVCDALAQEKSDEASADLVMTYCLDMVSFVTPWTALYAQLTDDPSMFMFGWASGSSDYPAAELDAVNVRSPAPLDITAIFCTPRYYSRIVNATVQMPSGAASREGIYPMGEREEIKPLQGIPEAINGGPLLNDTFGLEAIYLEKPGRPIGVKPIPLRFGYPPNKLVDLKHDLLERFGQAARPVNPVGFVTSSQSNIYMMVTNTLAAFALSGRSNDTAALEKLLDPKELESSIKKALRLWLAFAVATETASSNDGNISITVERKLPQTKITVNPYWSLAARIGLPLIAALAALLTYLLQDRPCHLYTEPSTMAEALKLLSTSPALCAVMRHSEYHPIKELMAEMDKREFFFRLGPNKEGTLQVRVFRGEGERAEEVMEGSEALNILEAPAPGAEVKKDMEWVSPDLIAMANLALFPVLIVVLIIINELSKKRDGYPMPGDPASFWSKVCFGTLPMAVAVGAEALLVILGTTQCMMAPYKALVTGRAKYADALDSQYKRHPPHLQLLHSFKRGQYLLLILSLTILISNALPMAISSIFSHAPHLPRIEKDHGPRRGIPRARQEMFFQLNMDMANPDKRPSWTTEEYYIDSPFDIAPIDERRAYTTRAFGVDVDCTVVPKDRVTFPCSNTTSARPTNASIPSLCLSEEYRNHDNVMFLNSPCGGTEDPIISYWDGTSGDQAKSAKECPGRIFPLWAQNQRWTVDLADRTAAPPYSPGYNKSFQFGTEDKYDFVVLNCSVTDLIASVRATVDDGKVTSLENVVPVSGTVTPSLARSFINVTTNLAKEYGIYGPNAIEDINWLMAQVEPDVVQGSETHVPSSAAAAATFADVLKRLFPLLVRLYAQEVFGVTYVTKFVDYRAHTMLIPYCVAMGVLALAFCVVVGVYRKHVGRVKGHLPWSLAGLYSQLYASNAKSDPNRASDPNGAAKESATVEAVELFGEYAYGDYPKELGMGQHYGVYRVVSRDQPSPSVELVT